MKQDIHPEYVDCVVKCSCGNTFTTRSTKPELKIDICNACHPFYTGTQKLIDTGGRVQRFADRFGSAKDVVAEREAAKKAERAAQIAEREAAKKAEREAKAAAKAERAAAFAAKAAEAAARAEAEEEVQNMEDAAAEATTEEAPGVELTEAEVEAAE
ncbi:MAG: 50S ribosomal protein L31 [Enterorhabdus sp.]|nr:50S ribosomal protein L31 [Enterorhabdus sp.]